MNYYRLEEKYVIDYGKELLFETESFGAPTYPVSYMEEHDYLEFSYKSGETVLNDYPENNHCWFLVSLKFEKILSKYYDNAVKVADVRVTDKETGNITDYKILHVEKELPAVNSEKSTYYEMEDNHQFYKVIDTYILNESVLQGHHLFRVEDVPGFYFVSEILKEEIEASAITGVRFVKVDVV